MADQADRVLQHPAMQALESLHAPLAEATAKATDEPNALTRVGRIKAMREHARATLTGADPILVTDQVLNAALSHVQNITAQVTNYANSSNAGYLDNALSEADGLLSVLARVPALIAGPRAAAVTRALGAYHEMIESYTSRVHEQLTALQNRLAQLVSTVSAVEQRVANAESRVDSIIAQYQSTFETTQAQRQQAFDSAQAQRQQAFDSDLTAHRTEFNDVAQGLRTDASSLLDSAKAQAADAIKALDEAIALARDTAKARATEVDTQYRGIAESLKEHLEKRGKEADKLVGLMGERAVTSTYQKTANEARTEMYVWQIITVLVMGTLLAGAIFEFLPALKNGWNWGIGGARLMVAIIATLLASYAGAQAKIARDTVRKNRRREMDLAALGPYLASLPEPDQHEIRTRIADRYFAEDEVVAGPAVSSLNGLLADPDIATAMTGLTKTAILGALKSLK